jgi:hypothetical protein
MLLATLILAELLSYPSSAADADQSTPYARLAHVRHVDHMCADLIRRGTAGSRTFRDLVARIESSDIIVYVERGQRLRTGVVGMTRLAGQAGRYRYVRVSIDRRVAGDEAVAIVGHELYHVTELAGAPYVVDGVGVRELYMTLGHRTCSGDPPCFDTAGARRAGDDVLRELRAEQMDEATR